MKWKSMFIDYPKSKHCPYCNKRLYRWFPFHYCKLEDVVIASMKKHKEEIRMNDKKCPWSYNTLFVECENCDGFDIQCEFYQDNVEG